MTTMGEPTRNPLKKFPHANVSVLIDSLEKEVEDYRHRLELAQQAGGIGIFDWDLETNRLWYSSEGLKVMGLEHKKLTETLDDWSQVVHSDDVQRVMDNVRSAAENRQDYDAEYRVLLPDKCVRWIRDKGKFFYKNGKAIRLLGVNYDISKRKKEEQHLRFKADGSKLLSASLSVDTAVELACDLAIKYIADWALFDILNPDGELHLMHVAHRDPAQVEFAKKFREKYPVDLNSNDGLPRVLRTGEPIIVTRVTPEMLEQIPDPEKRRMIEQVGLYSAIIVPVKVQDRVAGAISMVITDSRREYDHEDFEMAQQLASRVSLCLENARLTDQIQQERQRLIDLVSNVPCIVWEVIGKPGSGKQELTFINQYAEELLGYPLSRWQEMPRFWAEIIHPEDLPRLIEESKRNFETCTGGSNRFRWITSDGRVMWVETHTTIICDHKGRPIGTRGVTTDISKRMQLEQRKDDFIAMASHELKTPLTSLKIFSQVLQADQSVKNNPKLSSYLSKMEHQLDRLNDLVLDLLDISRIQAGKLVLEKTEFRLDELLEEVIQTAQSGQEGRLEFTTKLPLVINADRHRLTQVFVNLIHNAMKYSPEKSKVIIELKHKNQEAIVSIQDFGIGIPKEHHTKLFQRFYRVFDDTDKTFPGLGMGLFIAKNIVGKHDGKIWFTSYPDKGSIFYVSLPFQSSEERKNEKSSDHR